MNKVLHSPEDNELIAELLKKVESTAALNPQRNHAGIKKACDDCVRFGIGYLVPFRQYLPECIEYLKGSDVKIVEGFSDMPLASERLYTYESGLKMGVSELDMVSRMSLYFDGNYDLFQKEINDVVTLANRYGAPVKTIIETGFLTDEQKVHIAGLCLDAGATFIKLCVGMGQRKGRGTVHDVLLLKDAYGDRIKIKASGNLASLEDAYAMVRAGADRIAVQGVLADQLDAIGYKKTM